MDDSAASDPRADVYADVYIVECESNYLSDDRDAIDRAREALIDRVVELAEPRVVVDLSNTSYFGSAFVGLLFSLREKVARLGGRLVACGANDHCRDVLEVTRFTKVCPLFGSQSEAVRSLAE